MIKTSIRIYYSIILFSAVWLMVSCTSGSEESSSDLTVLKGATIYDGLGNAYENGVLIIKGDRIQTIGSKKTAVPENSNIIDVTGKYITPGMVDAHVHFFQTAFFDSRPDALNLRDSLPYEAVVDYQKKHPDRYYPAYLGSGVTAVYDVGGFPASIALQESAENNYLAPHVAASGTLITPVPEDYISSFNTPDDRVMVHLDSDSTGRATVKYLSDLGSTGIKIWSMQPQSEEFMSRMEAVADEVEKNNNKLIVHATTLEQAKAALRFGAKLLVHSVENEEVDQEFIDLMKKNNAVYNPTLVVHGGYIETYKIFLGQPFEITDPNGLVDQKTRDLLANATRYQDLVDTSALAEQVKNAEDRKMRRDSIMALNLKKLYDNNVLIAVGTDAGNPGTLHGISIFDELEAMQSTGIPAKEIIQMATNNGAIAMERERDFGSLIKGRMADLVILENDPAEDISNMRSITHVMRGGKLHLVEDL